MYKHSFKRFLFLFLSTITILFVIFVLFFRQSIQTALTLKQVDQSSNLFVIKNRVKYDLDDMLANNISGAKDLISYIANKISGGLIPKALMDKLQIESGGFGCTGIFAKAKTGNFILARNFDYGTDGGILVFSEPKDGYKSISMCSPEHLGLYVEDLKNNPLARLLLGGVPFIPVDGMNEKGLAITVNELTNHPAAQENGNPAVFTSCLVRLILDRCANVEDAVELLKTVDVHDNQLDMFIENYPGASYHYLIADSKGNSIVVEFDYSDNFKTIIVEKPQNQDYQVITNHYIMSSHLNEGFEDLGSGERFDTAVTLLEPGIEDASDCLRVLYKTKMDPPVLLPEYGDYYCGTKWSVVYDLTEKTVLVNMDGEKETYSFSMEDSIF